MTNPTDFEQDAMEVCRRIGRSTNRSWRALYSVIVRLQELGGSYTGPRSEFYKSFGTSAASNYQLTKCLTYAKILATNTQKGDCGKIWIVENAIRNYLTMPDGRLSITLRKPKKCPECGHHTNEYVDRLCLACYLTEKAKRERKRART